MFLMFLLEVFLMLCTSIMVRRFMVTRFNGAPSKGGAIASALFAGRLVDRTWQIAVRVCALVMVVAMLGGTLSAPARQGNRRPPGVFGFLFNDVHPY